MSSSIDRIHHITHVRAPPRASIPSRRPLRRSLAPSRPLPLRSSHESIRPLYQTALSNKISVCDFSRQKQDTLVRSTSRDRRNQPPPEMARASTNERCARIPRVSRGVGRSARSNRRDRGRGIRKRKNVRVVLARESFAARPSRRPRDGRFDSTGGRLIRWRTFASCAPLANETRRDARIARATRGSRGTVFHASFARLASVESRLPVARGVRARVNSRAASRPRRGAFERSLGTLGS